MAGRTTAPGQSVTARALAILDTFDVAHTEQSLSQIARRSELPLATAHRLIGELTAWGGLARRADGRYEIGRRLWELGLSAPIQVRLREVALPYLQALYEATRENVHLAVRDGNAALYVEKLAGHQSVPIVSRNGARLPLHATGVGKAMLAYESREFREQYLGHHLVRCTPYTIVQSGRMAADLERTVTQGYAVTIEEMTLGSCSVAAPILDGRRRPIAAVGVVVNSARVEPARLAPLIRTAAEGIAARLGAMPAIRPA